MPGAEFFVDANIVIYSAVPCQQRDACLEVLTAIANGHAAGRTSTAVLEEVWYIELSGKAGNLNGLTQSAFVLFSPLLAVTDQAFALALAVEGSTALGPNDRVHIGTCLANDITVILSADATFDSAKGVRRVDPLHAKARRQLLSKPNG
jgi:predicted nucleic acid-binding protein